MSNNKQSSSIDWIIKQLIFKTEFENLPNQYVLMSDKDIDSIIEQAKAMHKEEIIDANFYGQRLHAKSVTNTMMEANATEYYKETYGGNNED